MARGIEQLVNERILQWQAEQRSSRPPPSGVRRIEVIQRPMITISRECGSEGHALGVAVAERLGFSFYSQELVNDIAATAKVRPESVASLDEQARSHIEVMVREMLEGEAFSARDYQRCLRSTLRNLAANGRGVVLGRGAHLILDATLTLKVRTLAPLEKRAERVARREGIGMREAYAFVQRVDRSRAAFYRQHFGVDWADPASFDLLVNTSTAPLEYHAEVVAAAFRARFADT